MWGELEQAYGSAEDIPRLLAALYATHGEQERAELWFGVWATLHGDRRVLTAGYAAAPHLMALTSSRPFAEHIEAIHLVTRIETARHAPGAPRIPEELVASYAAAVESLPRRVSALMESPWDVASAQVLAAALLAGKHHPAVALALLEGLPTTD